jgi:hypothetical protein
VILGETCLLFLKWKFGHWEKASLNIGNACQGINSTTRNLGIQYLLRLLSVLPGAISPTSSSIVAAREAGIVQSIDREEARAA